MTTFHIRKLEKRKTIEQESQMKISLDVERNYILDNKNS